MDKDLVAMQPKPDAELTEISGFDMAQLLMDLTAEERALLTASSGLFEFFNTHLTYLAKALRSREHIVAKTLLGLHLSRPKAWSGDRPAPYYKIQYATKVKEFIDRYYAGGCKPILITYNTGKLSTTYLLFNQAWHYVCDHMDPERKYIHFFEEHQVLKYHDSNPPHKKGLLLRRIPKTLDKDAAVITPITDEEIRNNEACNDKAVVVAPSLLNWRVHLETWLSRHAAGEEVEAFKLEDQRFSPEDMQYVQGLAADFPELSFNMLDTYLSIRVRINNSNKVE